MLREDQTIQEATEYVLKNAWNPHSSQAGTLKKIGEEIVNFEDEEKNGEPDPWTKLGSGQIPVKGLWVVQGFNPVKMTLDMESQIGGAGGPIEQSYMYWEPQSAKDWYGIASQREYQMAQQGLPFDRIAKEIGWILRDTVGPDKKFLEILALGPGHADKEIRLVQELAESVPLFQHIRLSMLDISPPLIILACYYADEALRDDPRTSYGGILGDMFNLGQYDQIFHQSARRPVLATMFGGTLQTLQNETRFIQGSLGALKSGDLLLIHVSNRYTPSDDPEEIKRKDPRLSGKLPAGWDRAYRKFLEGPFRRQYQKQLEDVELKPVLDRESVVIPKSYAVDMQAIVKLTDGQKKIFSVMRFVRYDKNALMRTFATRGWTPICSWDFGMSNEQCIYLFQKQ